MSPKQSKAENRPHANRPVLINGGSSAISMRFVNHSLAFAPRGSTGTPLPFSHSCSRTVNVSVSSAEPLIRSSFRFAVASHPGGSFNDQPRSRARSPTTWRPPPPTATLPGPRRLFRWDRFLPECRTGASHGGQPKTSFRVAGKATYALSSIPAGASRAAGRQPGRYGR